MKVVVTGATGAIGSALVAALRDRGDQVTALVRDVERARRQLGDVRVVQAELETQGPWCDALDGAAAIVHLAGEPLDRRRWNARIKQLIRDSRVETTRTIVEVIARSRDRPTALITASGVDYYPFADATGEFDDDEVTESDPATDSFLGRLCRDWEREAIAADAHGVRVVCMRTGLVLRRNGGALARLRRPFELYAGGRIASGRQWVSWVHLDDVVRAYASAVADSRYRGSFNLVAGSVRNGELARALGRALDKPSWLPVPSFAVRAVLGSEFADSVLRGRRVVPARLRALGFEWQHGELDEAVAACVD